MQGLVTADGVNVARVSGIFKIGPPFDDTMRQASRCRAEAERGAQSSSRTLNAPTSCCCMFGGTAS